MLGIGTDLVALNRMAKCLGLDDNQPMSDQAFSPRGQAFVHRILTAVERQLCQAKTPQQQVSFIAKRWAGKEAASKAIGTGIAQGVTFQNFEILNDDKGAPTLTLSGQALVLAQAKGWQHYQISLADEQSHALAFVVLSSF